MRVRRKPALAGASFLLVASVIGLAIANGFPDVPPPTGIEFRDVFVDAQGAVVQPNLQPTTRLEFREEFIRSDGTVQAESLLATTGLLTRSVFVSPDGHVEDATLEEPPGILFTSLEISPDGVVLTENVQPPPGLVTRDVFIGPDGVPISDPPSDGPPAAGSRLLELQGAWPNPFNPSLEISFRLRDRADVEVQILDARGRLVRTLLREQLSAELHVLRWDGRDDAGASVASGSYLVRIRANDEETSVKATLMK